MIHYQKKIEPQMRLFRVYGNFFDTKEELKSYCEKNKITLNDVVVIEYLRNIAGRSDVIRTINYEGRTMLYTAVDRDGYGMYNYQRSVYRGEFIWEFNYGSIREMYEPFRERGVIFEDDVYGKIDESDRKIMQYVRENHLFNY